MPDRHRQHTGLSQLTQLSIPDPARRSPGAFAQSDLPGLAFASFAIEQLVALGPTHHKAHPSSAQFSQPRRSCIAAIKHVQRPSYPAPCALPQEVAFLFTCARRLRAFATPPAHTYHLHRPFPATPEHGAPLPASYHNRTPRLVEDPRSRTLQALRFAGTYRSQPLQFRTLWFF